MICLVALFSFFVAGGCHQDSEEAQEVVPAAGGSTASASFSNQFVVALGASYDDEDHSTATPRKKKMKQGQYEAGTTDPSATEDEKDLLQTAQFGGNIMKPDDEVDHVANRNDNDVSGVEVEDIGFHGNKIAPPVPVIPVPPEMNKKVSRTSRKSNVAERSSQRVSRKSKGPFLAERVNGGRSTKGSL
ncbi:unnamed protein product [Amoebophrya sp. A120]|nr:unnamed protein product [Amoebophrya sp. A120]|eukprot:GSA120T00018112001.1